MNTIFRARYIDWQALERAIGAIEDNLEKGTAFEQFLYFFFLNHADLYQVEELYSPCLTGCEIPAGI